MVSLRRFLKCLYVILPLSVAVQGKKQDKKLEKEPRREIDRVSDVGRLTDYCF